MSTLVMTLDRFRQLCGAYGARIERWPASEQEAARVLWASSAEAKLLLREEEALDVELSLQTAAEVSPTLLRALAQVPLRHPQRSFSLFKRWLWAPALGWSLAAVLGVVLGATYADVDDTTSTTASAELSVDAAADALALGDISDWEESAP
ncbi:MAG: hypothetical protein ACOY0T_22605 [Myxococcota bacterium]